MHTSDKLLLVRAPEPDPNPREPTKAISTALQMANRLQRLALPLRAEAKVSTNTPPAKPDPPKVKAKVPPQEPPNQRSDQMTLASGTSKSCRWMLQTS